MAGGELNLTADKRTPFWPDTIDIEGYDFSGAALLMHIRAAPGSTGTPLVELEGTASPAEGLSVSTFVADDSSPDYIEGETYSALSIRIDESTLEALSLGSPAHEPLVLYYDIHIGTGTAKRRWLFGTFTIDPGVTI